MKIGIITMISDNYGNRLQNYALQKVLIDLGNDVETLNNPWEIDYNPRIEKLKSILKKYIFLVTGKPKRYLKKINFENFNKRNIKFSKLWLNKYADRNIASDSYDILICGSDQVWNSEASEIDGRYFASFAPEEKRFSYAASFGIDEVIFERRIEFAEYLEGMNKISVREETGVEIIKQISSKEAECNVDPTLLLSNLEWSNLIPKKSPNKKYVFCYFLGDVSSEVYKNIEKFAFDNNLEINMISNNMENDLNNVGPEEFLCLIKNANFVFTDSFHGTVFSIIFERPFYVFDRTGVKKGMSTRITSLLKLLGLNERFNPPTLNNQKMYDIDFVKTKEIINNERKKSIDYLKMITRN